MMNRPSFSTDNTEIISFAIITGNTIFAPQNKL